MSTTGIPLFDNNLGFQSKDGEVVPVDIFDSSPFDNGFMSCRLYFGDQLRSVPARLVCGFFAADIVYPQPFRFAFGFQNPSVNTQLSIPIIVYSYDPFSFKKHNFNLVNAAVYVYSATSFLSKSGYFNTSSTQLQMQNDTLMFGEAHTDPLFPGDAYVVKFNFPLRVNGLYPNYCLSSSGVIYGDAYYHWNLGVIVCKVTATTIQPQGTPPGPTMNILGFYTPWYSLADG
jgi:hypothetical protein